MSSSYKEYKNDISPLQKHWCLIHIQTCDQENILKWMITSQQLVCLIASFSHNTWCVSISRRTNKKEFVSFYEVLQTSLKPLLKWVNLIQRKNFTLASWKCAFIFPQNVKNTSFQRYIIRIQWFVTTLKR